MASPPRSLAYSERLHVPPGWWLLGLAFVLAVGWVFFVATPHIVTLVAVAVTAAVVVVALQRYGELQVQVDDQTLRAGRGVLPLENVGRVQAFDAASTRRQLGPDADARAYLVTRPYCATSVRVEVVDDRDPTPYWLISTRRPEELAASLRGSRGE